MNRTKGFTLVEVNPYGPEAAADAWLVIIEQP